MGNRLWVWRVWTEMMAYCGVYYIVVAETEERAIAIAVDRDTREQALTPEQRDLRLVRFKAESVCAAEDGECCIHTLNALD